MNEQAVRDVVLVRAIESADRAQELLSDGERSAASRSARERAQWLAAQAGSQPTAEDFLHQRAGLILQRMTDRFPAFAPLLRLPGAVQLAWNWLPPVALLAGLFLDQITNPHRVDLLSAPFLLLIGWNLAVYAAMLIWPWLPLAKAHTIPKMLGRLPGVSGVRLPRKLPAVLTNALTAFIAEWARLGRPLLLARLGRALHLGAALFAVGAVISLYARGYVSQYAAGWESTFLDARQVHALLSALFAPAVAIFGLQGFSVADIEALRFGQAPANPAGGARWVHLYAATLGLLVVLPRAVLAGMAHARVSQGARAFALDLSPPYFLRLLRTLGGTPGLLRVLPYSFTVDEARSKALHLLATRLLGEQAGLVLRPPIPYGDDAHDALRGFDPNDAGATLTAVLFSLSATPEKENHGALLDVLVRESARGIAVLVDESGYLERVGNQAGGQARIAERIALWQQFCSFHKAPVTLVNLLDPGARPLDSGAGLAVSSSP